MIPARIPINGFAILSKASVFVALSAIEGMIVVTNPVERSVVIISHEARAAIPPVPSFFSDIPTPTPIAKRIAMLPIRASPAFTKNRPIRFAAPWMSPPCIAAGHNLYPIPMRIPQIGRIATGSINALPSFCKNFMFFLLRNKIKVYTKLDHSSQLRLKKHRS